MNIRPFREFDLKTLEKFYFNSRKLNFYWMDQGMFSLKDFLNDTKEEKIFVAIDNNTIIGFISILEDESLIHHLFVNNIHNSSNIKKSLLDFAKNLYSPLKIKSYVKNFKDNDFLEEYGFEILYKEEDSIGEFYYLMQLK